MSRQTRRLLLACAALAWLMAAWPQEAAAQRRAVRRRPARSVVIVAPRVFHRPFYNPFFYRPFYRPFYGGWYNPYYFGWGFQYPYPPYYYPVYDRTGSARLDVSPPHTEVYIDGYFVGVVDDFDGVLQRLHVETGEHELALYLEGYRTFRQNVRLTPGTTLKITHVMEPLGAGETAEPKPQPDPARAQYEPGPRQSRQYGRARQSEFGTVSLGVQPQDAVVVIDGQEWDRPEAEARFVIDLPAGPHRLEVRKEGFKTYLRTIQVRRGQTLTLNVSLTGLVRTSPGLLPHQPEGRGDGT